MPLARTSPDSTPNASATLSSSTTLGGTLNQAAARLANALENWPRRTLTLAELWQIFDTVDPGAAVRLTGRSDLAALLDDLVEAERIELRGHDLSEYPPLPRSIRTKRARRAPGPRSAHASVDWHSDLDWAAEARLNPQQVRALRRINDWLRDHKADYVVPLRERSLEIFGNERALDRLLDTSVFGPGRLTLELLRARRCKPPLPARRVGDGPALLVVSNADTYDSISRLLASRPGEIGWVAWGAGEAFESSVASVPELSGVRAIFYYGDVDADGLRIPEQAGRVAADLQLPEIVPAAGLYRLLIRHGRAQSSGQAVSAETARQLAAWLPFDLRHQAFDAMVSGHRLPQEVTGLRLLASDTSWRDLGP